ncbi:MAG: hypothetical protein R3250_09060, partial [Melioribacteraceae bacterium]|nr:hypothetical protein [Melioribacteraceae bacterium]
MLPTTIKITLKTLFAFIIFIIIFGSANITIAQIHSSTSAYPTFKGLSMTGYQGWFSTPGDGARNNWTHYRGSDGFKPGSASIEYWPDMRETDPDERYITDFV